MSNRSTKGKKKAMPTKYSAIGATIVPLAQQMRNSRSHDSIPSTPKANQDANVTDNFFDDIMGDWHDPTNDNNATQTHTKPQTKPNIMGIHKQNDDVSSSSPSLSFTATPPPKEASADRSIYMLGSDTTATQPQTHTNIAIIPPNNDKAASQIPENSNYSRSIFDDIITEKPIQNNTDIDIAETVQNDPNYLPPPEENAVSVNNSTDGEDSDSNDSEEDEEHKPDINPWAHLNKTGATNITEAPIEDEDEPENRVFLRHDSDDDSDKIYEQKRSNDFKHEWFKKSCYCLIFVLGIAAGILLTIALIRHRAIDANYLFDPPSMEMESGDLLNTQINNINVNDTIVNKHRIDSYDEYESNIGENELIAEVKGHKTQSPTIKPTKSPSTTHAPTMHPTKKPTMNPTHAPLKKVTTNKPTKTPTKVPSMSPVLHIIVSKSSKSTQAPNVSEKEDIEKGDKSTTQTPTKADKTVIDSSQDERTLKQESVAVKNDAIDAIKPQPRNTTQIAATEPNTIVSKTTNNPSSDQKPESTLKTDNIAIESSVQSKSNLTQASVNSTTSHPSASPIAEKSRSTTSNSDEPQKEDTYMSSVPPLCDVVPQSQCNKNKHKALALPFDKPLTAQLRCHQNTCSSPPSLRGQRIISGETYESGKTILDIQESIPTECHTDNLQSIKVHRDGYNNNEDWRYCLRISNDDTLPKYPVLHITFALIEFDLEQGFDNLFFTTQFNDIYDDYAEVWTGNSTTLHTLEPNTWYQNFWMTSSEPNAFAEFCLRLQSDESVTGKGFVAEFSVTQEVGFWGEFSECRTHSANLGVGNDACGVGVQSRVSLCPPFIQAQEGKSNEDRFDWKNDTHSCINQYSNYPINKYCIVADCNDVDNLHLAPQVSIESARKRGTTILNNYLYYIYNGVSRIDPQYADPFKIVMNTGRKAKEINLYKLKEDLQSEIDSILSRYSPESQALFPDVLHYEHKVHFNKLGVRLLSSLILGRVFTFVTTGSSNTAGHDNVFMSSYPQQLQSLMQVIWNKYGVYGSAFRIRNQAIGGHLGTEKQGPCISAIIGTYDKNIDMISWESFMNDGSHINPLYEEIWLRNILNTYPNIRNIHSQPFITCISTNDDRQAGCLQKGRYVFNSFMKYYYSQTGVANYYGQHVCQGREICKEDKLDANGTNIKCLEREENEACRAANVMWHPSAHRHRVMAETFAVNFMRAAIEAIDRLYDDIQNNMDSISSYELACLLEGYNSTNNATQTDNNHAVFERPLTDVCTDCGEICTNAMWCAISFWPSPKHNQLHRYFVHNNGWINNDTIDLPVDPLIMRNGGRASIDHKAQWSVYRFNVGASLQIMVKVPTRYIMIVYAQGMSRIKIVDYFDAFEFIVNGEKKICQATPYDLKMQRFCLLDCEKPGKYLLSMNLVSDINPAVANGFKTYSIDEIAGI